MKKLYILSSFLFMPLITQAKTFREAIQEGINDYFIPILIFLFILSAATGLLLNWKKINDPDDEGRRKEGLQQVGMIALYAFLAISVLGIVVGLFKNYSITI